MTQRARSPTAETAPPTSNQPSPPAPGGTGRERTGWAPPKGGPRLLGRENADESAGDPTAPPRPPVRARQPTEPLLPPKLWGEHYPAFSEGPTPGRTPGSRPGCARSRSDGTSPSSFKRPSLFPSVSPCQQAPEGKSYTFWSPDPPTCPSAFVVSEFDQIRAGARTTVSPLRAARHTFSRFSSNLEQPESQKSFNWVQFLPLRRRPLQLRCNLSQTLSRRLFPELGLIQEVEEIIW